MAARAAAFLSVVGARLGDSLAGFTAARRARRTAWLPQGLSHRELKDIGLCRSGITFAVAEGTDSQASTSQSPESLSAHMRYRPGPTQPSLFGPRAC
jgi:uncharacterized protein YjiS (DUF1127 family)